MQTVGLRFLEGAGQLKQLAEGEIGLHRAQSLAHNAGELRDNRRRGDLIHDRLHEFLLAGDAADVALLVAVSHIGHGGNAVHVLHAGIEVDHQPSRGRVVPFVDVIHARIHIDVDAADGVYDAGEGAGIDEDVMIDGGVEEILDGLPGQFPATVCVGGIDLIVASANEDAGIAGNGEERHLLALWIYGGEHQRVRAPYVVGAFIDAHDHDRCFVRGDEQGIVVQPGNTPGPG